MNSLPRIGLMPGDVTGIGPEIAAKLLASSQTPRLAEVVIIGDRRVLELGMHNAGVSVPFTPYRDYADIRWPREDYPLLDLGNTDPAKYPQGKSSDEAGRLAGDTLKAMIDLAQAGQIDGICFAPLNKGAMNRGGWKFNDEHQMFASLLNHRGFFGEMNVINQFSTFRVTSHVALREAVNMITPDCSGKAATAHRRRGAQPPQRRKRPLRRRGNPHHPPDGGRAQGFRHRLHRADLLGCHFPAGTQGQLRRCGDDVP
jgi:4-hydroxythreonine-4-phosphate dehydrogenase